MRAVILGGGGFLGHHIIQAFLNDSIPVLVLDQRPPSQTLLSQGANWLYCNFLDCEFDFLLQKEDCVIHLVHTLLPAKSNERPIEDVSSNLIPSIRLIESCVRVGVKKILFASSGGTVYGHAKTLPTPEQHGTDPICSYGIVKLAVEKYLQLFGTLHQLQHLTLRIANPYGPHQDPNRPLGAVSVFLNKILKNEPIEIWGDGSIVRDYIWAEDVAKFFLLGAKNDTQNKILNLGTGIGTSLNALISKIELCTGKTANVKRIETRNLDVQHSTLDTKNLLAIFGHTTFTSLDQGIVKLHASINKLQKLG